MTPCSATPAAHRIAFIAHGRVVWGNVALAVLTAVLRRAWQTPALLAPAQSWGRLVFDECGACGWGVRIDGASMSNLTDERWDDGSLVWFDGDVGHCVECGQPHHITIDDGGALLVTDPLTVLDQEACPDCGWPMIDHVRELADDELADDELVVPPGRDWVTIAHPLQGVREPVMWGRPPGGELLTPPTLRWLRGDALYGKRLVDVSRYGVALQRAWVCRDRLVRVPCDVLARRRRRCGPRLRQGDIVSLPKGGVGGVDDRGVVLQLERTPAGGIVGVVVFEHAPFVDDVDPSTGALNPGGGNPEWFGTVDLVERGRFDRVEAARQRAVIASIPGINEARMVQPVGEWPSSTIIELIGELLAYYKAHDGWGDLERPPSALAVTSWAGRIAQKLAALDVDDLTSLGDALVQPEGDGGREMNIYAAAERFVTSRRSGWSDDTAWWAP